MIVSKTFIDSEIAFNTSYLTKLIIFLVKNEQIPRVTIKRIISNNKPGYVAHIDKSLYENDECRINMQKPDSRSSQCIQFLPEDDVS